MAPIEDTVDNRGAVSEDSTGSEDDDDDEYQEHAVDVDSIVLPIFTQDLLLFTSAQMPSLLNYPVLLRILGVLSALLNSVGVFLCN